MTWKGSKLEVVPADKICGTAGAQGAAKIESRLEKANALAETEAKREQRRRKAA